MPEFTVQIEFEVFCAKCGAGLCNQSTTHDSSGYGYSGRGRRVDVEPCEKCLDTAKDEGYGQGYEDGEAHR